MGDGRGSRRGGCAAGTWTTSSSSAARRPRPARNIASVTISLDNSERKAPESIPGGLNDSDEIEVERRIDRGKGSTYRVNGREQRARDVQLLFADAASGAGSTALIGQGKIGWLISTKPSERRQILEEAAGIGQACMPGGTRPSSGCRQPRPIWFGSATSPRRWHQPRSNA